jgi:hypothetical protein
MRVSKTHSAAALLAALPEEVRQIVMGLPLTPAESELMLATIGKPQAAGRAAWDTILRARCYQLDRLQDDPDPEPQA